MLLYVGHLKKVYTDWEMNPHRGDPLEPKAHDLWPSGQTYQSEHETLREIAPLFPPYGWLNERYGSRGFLFR